MKQCIGCIYANWDKTKYGRLHPSGDGRCTDEVKMPTLPASMHWGWRWDEKPPRPGVGWINRKDSDRHPCPCRADEVENA